MNLTHNVPEKKELTEILCSPVVTIYRYCLPLCAPVDKTVTADTAWNSCVLGSKVYSLVTMDLRIHSNGRYEPSM